MAAPTQNTNTGTSTPAQGPLAGGQLAQKSQAATAQAQQQQAAQPTLSSQMAQDASQADITNEDLFPGMNQKINVGNFSSPVLGSRPIFVAAGQYVPYNILNKKEEAIAKAAKKRAERQAKFDPGKASELKNKLYQRSLNDDFNNMTSDFISTAQKMSPDNWDVMLNDRGTEIGKLYAQQKSNYEVLAQESDVIFTEAAQVISDAETGGDTIYHPDTLNMAREVQGRTTNALKGGLENLREFTDKFNGSFDLDKHLANNNVVTQMKADITATLAPGGGGMTVETEESFKDRIEAYAESETATPAGRYYKDNIIKKQDIIDRLTGLLGTKESKSFKYKPTSGGIYAGKKQDRKDRTQKRYETEKAILLDPRSQKAQEALGSLVGVKYGKGVNTAAEYSFPEDYNNYRDAGSSLTDFYDSFKDETTGVFFKDNVFETGAKDKFNAERAKLGLSEDITSVKLDSKDKNIVIVNNNKGQSKRIDM
jgi:hypothetical protein